MELPRNITPFLINIDAETLSDLRKRIRHTRWPDSAPGAAWEQGTDLDYLRRLLAYWGDEFDWRAQERALNATNQFQAELDGVRIHFVHVRAKHGDGIPLILTPTASRVPPLTWLSLRGRATASPSGRLGWA